MKKQSLWAILVIALVVLSFVPNGGIRHALAHHNNVTQVASCSGYHVAAQYVGGSEWRRVVWNVNLTVDGVTENISGTWSGFSSGFTIFDRTGVALGSVQASGFVRMYTITGSKVDDDNFSLNWSEDCRGTAQVSHLTCTEMLIVLDKAPAGLSGTTASATIQRPDGSSVTVTSGGGYYPGGSNTAKWGFAATGYWNGNGTYIVTSVSLPAAANAVVHNLPYSAQLDGCYRMCPWNPTIPEFDPACQEPMCQWDPTIPQSDPNCYEPCPYDATLHADDPLCVPPVCQWNSELTPDDPNCYEPCQYDAALHADDPLCVPPVCQWNSELTPDDPNCYEPCQYDAALHADDPLCVPPVCQWNPELTPDDPNCYEHCQFNPELHADDPLCVPPVCEWDPALTPDDPNCYEPCEWDDTIPADNEQCKPPVTPTVVPTVVPTVPYIPGPNFCYIDAIPGVDPHVLTFWGNAVVKWEFNDGLPGSGGRFVIFGGVLNEGEPFTLEAGGQSYGPYVFDGDQSCVPQLQPLATATAGRAGGTPPQSGGSSSGTTLLVIVVAFLALGSIGAYSYRKIS